MKILGIDTSVNKNIDSSKYYKGAVPFDGITRKSIVEVIPTYLAKILSAISGDSDSVHFDFDKGKWIKIPMLWHSLLETLFAP